MNNVEQVVGDFFAAQNAMDTERLFSLCSDDIRFEDVPFRVVANGKNQYKAVFSKFFGAISNGRTELKMVVAAGEWAAAEWVFSGTQKGDFPRIPATGKSFSIRGVSICQIQDGKIRNRTDYWDSASMMKQLGTMPERT